MMASNDELRALAEQLRIAHHIPGRVRFKISNTGVGQVQKDDESEAGLVKRAKAFQKSLVEIPGITKVKLNALAKSCLVEYNAEIIDPAAWDGLVLEEPTDVSKRLIDTLTEKYNEVMNIS